MPPVFRAAQVLSTAANHYSQARTAAGIAQLAYPTSALLSFLALRSICLYNNHGSFPRLADAFVQRNVLLGLVALIISTYVSSPLSGCVTVGSTHSDLVRLQVPLTSSSEQFRGQEME